MDVILLEKVANLGGVGDKVKVKSGYARNYLLPEGKATLATPENIAKFEEHRVELEARAANALERAQARAAELQGFKVTIASNAGAEGKLFGSIGTTDIADACTAAGVPIERAEVRLPEGPIRLVGEHTVTLHLHTDVETDLQVEIVPED